MEAQPFLKQKSVMVHAITCPLYNRQVIEYEIHHIK